jgi:hypothetical protein
VLIHFPGFLYQGVQEFLHNELGSAAWKGNSQNLALPPKTPYLVVFSIPDIFHISSSGELSDISGLL